MKSKKIKEMPDPEKQFHENMILYKDSLPPFFKSTKYVLINKEGELLQEETEALRVHLSPNPEYLNEFEVPVSNEDESVNFNESRKEHDRLIQLIPKKFKENLVYKYKDKHTDERMKSVRELKKLKIPLSDIKSEVGDENIEIIRKYADESLLSPHNINNYGKNKISMLSENESKFSPVDKSMHIKEMQRSMLHKDYFSDDEQDSGNASIAYLREPIDMVNLQNEAFSKMFVETPIINNPPYYNTTKIDSKIVFHKSTYPRSKIPQELKEKFDLISDNFNYNDEFWRPENIEKQSKLGNISVNKRVNTSVIKSGDNSIIKSPKGSIDPRSVTAVPQNKKGELQEPNQSTDVAYIKSDWIAKIIKIKEGLDKKCK